MANVLRFDPATGRPLAWLLSVNTPDYEGRADCLINPPLPSTFGGLPLHHFKIVGGAIVELSAAEKQSLDDAAAAGALAAVRTDAKNLIGTGDDDYARALKAVVKIFLQELNAIRTNAALNLPPRTATQIKNAIEAEIDA